MMGGYLDNVYTTWLKSPVTCCFPASDQKFPRDDAKPMRLVKQQPSLIAPPTTPVDPEHSSSRGRWARRKSVSFRPSRHGNRRRSNAHKMIIGPPTDFRHLDQAGTGPQDFRPLELSIYDSKNHLSPILPLFWSGKTSPDDPDATFGLPKPRPAFTHTRSDSDLNRFLPKPIWLGSSNSRPTSLSIQDVLDVLESDLPKAPAPALLRSMTDPSSYERVKSALQERHELERTLRSIEVTIQERRSVYNSNQNSRRASRVRSISPRSRDPMPAPPATPSFAVSKPSPSANQRRKLSSLKPLRVSVRKESFTHASAILSSPASTISSFHPDVLSPMPPPPLPLVFKAAPPSAHRKSKSFSRIKKWLYSTEHARHSSINSVTNQPKAVHARDGFYQCVDPEQQTQQVDAPRNSAASLSTILTVESEPEKPTVAPDWTPNTTPRWDVTVEKPDVVIRDPSMDDGMNENSPPWIRVGTFGEDAMNDYGKWKTYLESLPNNDAKPYIPSRNSVGIAF